MKRTFNLLIFVLLALALPWFSNPMAVTKQSLPSGLPGGLPDVIKGNYRVIEHSADKKVWVAYDAKGWKKIGDSIRMFPPVYRYEFEGNGKWSVYLHEIAIENIFMEGLVTIIDKKANLSNKPTIKARQFSTKEIEKKIISALKYKRIWSLKSFSYNNGVLVCGNNEVMPEAQAMWWSDGSKIYNVNGIARGNTPKFDLTFDVDIGEALQKCK